MDEDEKTELLAWAHEELRDLDELCRSMVPGYDTFSSDDMKKLNRLLEWKKELESE